MKPSLIALIACCAVSSTAFAQTVDVSVQPPQLRTTDDMPGDHPPQLRLTDDMPGDHPPQRRLTDDMPGDHPPQAQALRRLELR